MDESLTPFERIRKRNDFFRLYKSGKRYRGKYFNLIYLFNDFNYSRVAVVVAKKIGNAVCRIKIKRWIRVLFRRNKPLIQHSLDMVIIAKESIREATWQQLQDDYFKAIQSICHKDRSHE